MTGTTRRKSAYPRQATTGKGTIRCTCECSRHAFGVSLSRATRTLRETSMRITDKPAAQSSRRRFLQAGAALAGGSAVGALGGTDTPAQAQVSENLPPNVPEWMKAPGAPTGDQLYGAP